MKKIFFCAFSIIFISLCVWLGMYGETYAVFVDSSGITFTTTFQLNDDSVQSIMTALSNFNFTYNGTQYLTYDDIVNNDYIFFQGNLNADATTKANAVIDVFPSGCSVSYSYVSSGLNYYKFSATPHAHIQVQNDSNTNKTYPLTMKVAYWYKPNGDWYSYPLPNTENKRLLSNFDFTYTPPDSNEVTFEGSLGGGSNEEEEKDLLETIQDFFSNFGDNLVHIVVPSQEDMEELQESFSDNILDKFSITAISRSSSYDNNSLYSKGYKLLLS